MQTARWKLGPLKWRAQPACFYFANRPVGSVESPLETGSSESSSENNREKNPPLSSAVEVFVVTPWVFLALTGATACGSAGASAGSG